MLALETSLFYSFLQLRFQVDETNPLREGELDLAGIITPYDVTGTSSPGYVDKDFAEVPDFIEYPTLVWYSWYYCYSLYVVTGARLLRDRLLGPPDVRNRPWPLRRPRGDGSGGRCACSPCLRSWCSLRLSHCTPDAVPLVPVQLQSMELPATTFEDTRVGHELSLNSSHQVLLQCAVFKCRCEKCNKDPQ